MTTHKPDMSDEAVKGATGNAWDEWFALLDSERAADLKHPQIARLLEDKFGVSGWWAQTVTVEYERARGLRAKYQKKDGFAVSVSKTVPVPVGRLYSAWAEDESCAVWLGHSVYEITTATKDKAMRIAWDGGASRVDVCFNPKGEAKSLVSIQHSRLESSDRVEEMREFWRSALGRMVDTFD